MNILIIEDDLILRKVLSHHLLEKGYTVTSAANGQEAIELLEKNLKADLIICDIIMPVTSGPTFILLLNKYFKQKFPKLVIISGVKEGENFVKKLDVKYDHFLPKPIDFKRLGEIISDMDQSTN